MNELIPIQNQADGAQAVTGRNLYEFLEVKSNYTEWFDRMIGYGFIEGQDFIRNSESNGRGRPVVNHIMSLDMAKEVAMIQRTTKGKQARQYFIEVEKRYQAGEMNQLDEAKLVQRALQVTYRQVQELTAANEEMAPKAGYFDEFVADEDLIQFRSLANQLNIGERELRELLISKKWIYKLTGNRWSNKHDKIITVYQYRAYADKKHLFRLVPCHEAPRINGEVQQALKLTPRGAESVAAAIKKWGSVQTQLGGVEG